MLTMESAKHMLQEPLPLEEVVWQRAMGTTE